MVIPASAAVMLLGLLPMTALAAEGEDKRTVPLSSLMVVSLLPVGALDGA